MARRTRCKQRRMGTCRITALASALSAMYLVASPAAAQDLKYQVGVSLLHSDNIDLASIDEQSDTVLSPFLQFQYNHDAAALHLEAKGRAQWLSYLQGTYDDELRSEFSGQLRWELAPERLYLYAEDVMIRQPVDVLTALVPGNQQQVNVFFAGPTLLLRFGDATRAQVDIRYGNTHAESTDAFNGDRYRAAAKVIRDVSPTTSASVAAESAKIDFDNDLLAEDYSRHSLVAGVTHRLRSLDIDLDAGWARITRNSGPTLKAPIGRGRAAWVLSPRSSLWAGIDFDLGDSAQYAVALVDRTTARNYLGLTSGDISAGPEIFRSRSMEVGYRYVGDRWNLSLVPRVEHYKYYDANAKVFDLQGVRFGASRRMTESSTVEFAFDRRRREFNEILRTDHDSVFELAYLFRMTQNWSWRFDVLHRKRSSNFSDAAYSVNEAAFAIVYQP